MKTPIIYGSSFKGETTVIPPPPAADNSCICIRLIQSDPDHPSAISISQALADGYTGSKASLQTAIAWLVECESSHPGCTPPVVPLPYRILELHSGSNGQISARVLEDSGRVEPYACLSHRWGPSTPFCRTLKENLTAHRESVPWTKLPKTFQQAAMVTVRLGLKYLWIDSLCIVQDDSEDWMIQAAQMCDIFRGSRVTLAATNSTDSGDGLFRSVHKVELKPVGRKDKKVTMRISPSHSTDPRDRRAVSNYPLLTRGWVFQERLLSSRTIHFSIDELSFECRQLQAQCECGTNAAWDQDRVDYSDSFQVTDVVNVRNQWHHLVNDFSVLDLTFHSDRLPALAGIARQFGTTHKEILGRYVAGLWAHTLLHDLLWHTAVPSPRQPPKARAAPSWSWAASPSSKNWNVYPKATDDLQVVSFRVDLAGPDEYGPVKLGATVTLRGYLAPGSLKILPETSEGFSTRTPSYVHWAAKNEPTKTCPMWNDYLLSTERNEGYIQPGSTLYLLKTGFIVFQEVKCQMCLVLLPIDEGNSVYERVGMVDEAPQDDVDLWFRDAPAQVLTLV